MAYADYEFYTATYLGAAVPEAAFPRMAARASEYLDDFTSGRAAMVTGAALEAVRRCCCAMAETLYAEQQAAVSAADGGPPEGAVLKAETNGTWRQEYELTAAALKTAEQKLYDGAKRYLAAWGLLYRGVRPCVH